MALNVMVAQDERFGESDKGIAEVLGYLANLVKAFVYHHRKNAKKENCPLYGIATDSTTFHFVRLDNDSTYVTTTLDSRVDLEKTFGLLVHVLKEASAVSSTQPTASFTQPDQGEGSTEPLVPTESSLRRKVDKRMQYERLKYETSEDEYSEDG
ncbi:uncharacterized protein N7506_000444 [Penicillium brevicompactum]|uniref:uncharacterized protein n=1 Tax=Penicillium brevicompactum TaxID=5074 RepID=UPI002541C77F|nr:uncharacterized protein N7506_000444 [Penicillium brevicompactum]KAJ5347191.1 hypothetical protein N7506_000444 [Penicillium brevicompactum]